MKPTGKMTLSDGDLTMTVDYEAGGFILLDAPTSTSWTRTPGEPTINGIRFDPVTCSVNGAVTRIGAWAAWNTPSNALTKSYRVNMRYVSDSGDTLTIHNATFSAGTFRESPPRLHLRTLRRRQRHHVVKAKPVWPVCSWDLMLLGSSA